MFSNEYKVKGRVLEGYGLLVQGKRVKPDKKGYFTQRIVLKEGVNTIQFAVLDSQGDITYLKRRITYQR